MEQPSDIHAQPAAEGACLMPTCGGCGHEVAWDLRPVALADTTMHLCPGCDGDTLIWQDPALRVFDLPVRVMPKRAVRLPAKS
jgi:hypothetical protein